MESENNKINKGTRKNSSLTGAAMFLGVSTDTIEELSGLMSIYDRYMDKPEALSRRELMFALKAILLSLEGEELEDLKKQNPNSK
jgi:DNA-binding response OmpR family regulator